MAIDTVEELWDELDEASMNDQEYNWEEDLQRESVREPEWDSARDMEESDG